LQEKAAGNKNSLKINKIAAKKRSVVKNYFNGIKPFDGIYFISDISCVSYNI
jgi:hypothetical protein